MPFDYANKGWPASLTLDGDTYKVSSCDKDDTGLVYSQDGTRNPHITIHGINKEGIFSWDEMFHVRMSNTKLFEYKRDKPDDFVTTSGKKATGAGTIEQRATANKLAKEFYAAIRKAITS